MLGNRPFYFALTRKYVATFGALFRSIVVPRYDAEGNVVEEIKVPLTYGPKEKVLARLTGDPDIERPFAAVMPFLSFELNGLRYRPEDANSNTIRNARKFNEEHTYKTQFVPAPWDFEFSLYVFAKEQSDGLAIIEQILPFFKPNFPLTIELIPEMSETRDVPVVLNSVSMTDTYDRDFEKRRELVWELKFTMKAFLWGPIVKNGVIKFANVSFYTSENDTIANTIGTATAIDRVTAQPGLTANGEPTTNVALSIPYTQIDPDDNYAVILTIYGTLDPQDGIGGSDEEVPDE
jgi:hypothetical protein